MSAPRRLPRVVTPAPDCPANWRADEAAEVVARVKRELAESESWNPNSKIVSILRSDLKIILAAIQTREITGEALQKVHRYALAAESAGYDLILSVTDPIISAQSTDSQTNGEKL